MQAGDRATTALRVVLATVATIDLLSFRFYIADARTAALTDLVPVGDLPLALSASWLVTLAVIVGCLGAIRFGLRPGRIVAGIVALLALAFLSSVHAQLFGSPWRHLYYSGLCLSGWLLGLFFARRAGAIEEEAYARTGVVALLGAAYFNAGVSKMIYGGVPWLSGLPIQGVILGQDGLAPDSFLSGYRTWVVMHPAAAMCFSTATVVVELAGPLMIAGVWLRRAVAFGLLAMHANIFLLTDILYWESILFLTLFGLLPGTWVRSPGPVVRRPRESWLGGAGYAAAFTLLLLTSVLAVGRQWYRQPGYVPSAASQEPAPTSPPTPVAPDSPGKLGPFTRGEVLKDDWRVSGLERRENGIRISFSSAVGSVGFEITCVESTNRSPFDAGPLHIFYSTELPPPKIEGIGRAVRARVLEQGATDPCARLAEWRSLRE